MDPYLAEIRWFAGNFAPRSWAFCHGALLSIAANAALFSLLGTTYGGDGRVTFALPDFRGRVPVGTGTGAGLPGVLQGQMSGSSSVTLLSTNLPAHIHNTTMTASSAQGTSTSAAGNLLAASNDAMYSPTASLSAMQPAVPTSFVGSNTPVRVMQPYLGMNFIIAVEGFYPSRN